MAQVLQWSALFLMLQSAFAEVYNCQQSSLGQVMLYFNGNEPPNVNSRGVVQVCIQNATGHYHMAAFCYNESSTSNNVSSTFNKGAAAASCRQIGYTTFVNYNSSSALKFSHPPDVEYFISNIHCPNVVDYTTQGELALLRCSHSDPLKSTNISTVCPTSQLAAVECMGTSIIDPEVSYNGQVYRHSLSNLGEPIYGHIFLDGEALPICMDDYTQASAHSICQQLGYTEALNWYPEYTITDSWYLGSELCGSGPYPCFTHCFDTSNYTKLSTCDGGRKGFGMQCILIEADTGVYGSGSKGLCQIDTSFGIFTSEEIIIIVISVCIPLIIIAIIVVTFGVLHYWKGRNRRRPGYGPVNNEAGGEGNQERHD